MELDADWALSQFAAALALDGSISNAVRVSPPVSEWIASAIRGLDSPIMRIRQVQRGVDMAILLSGSGFGQEELMHDPLILITSQLRN